MSLISLRTHQNKRIHIIQTSKRICSSIDAGLVTHEGCCRIVSLLIALTPNRDQIQDINIGITLYSFTTLYGNSRLSWYWWRSSKSVSSTSSTSSTSFLAEEQRRFKSHSLEPCGHSQVESTERSDSPPGPGSRPRLPRYRQLPESKTGPAIRHLLLWRSSPTKDNVTHV